MKRTHLRTVAPALPGLLALTTPSMLPAAAPPLIVVEDLGGASAQPYYQALGLTPRAQASPHSAQPWRDRVFREADLLPARSTRLTPGLVESRVLRAPGLLPVFLIGDDPRSRDWLRRRLNQLRALGAIGLVVQVETPQALAALRALAPGLTLAPVSGDELAQRLGVRHYPVLITATAIEQ